MKKSLVVLFLLLSLTLFVTVPALAANVKAVEVTAFAETRQEGQTVVGARVEYPAEVESSAISFSSFSVLGYDIAGYYVNNSGEWDDADPSGKYVFLKLAVNQVPGYRQGKTLMNYDGGTKRVPANLNVRQNSNLPLADGNTAAAFPLLVSSKDVNILSDEFLDLSYTDSTGFKVTYRLFVPEGYEKKSDALEDLPIVVFFHGGGEGGTDNLLPIVANPSALEFAKPEAQAKNPCFVMAPQSVGSNSTGGSWATNAGTEENPQFTETPSLHAAIEALYKLMETYNIDVDRVYGTGLSQGSRGVWISSILYPDLYAAQLNIASADFYSDEQLKLLVNQNIWILVSANDREDRTVNHNILLAQLEKLGAVVNRKIGDDAFNGYLRGYAANQEVMAQWEEAKSQGAKILLTHFIPGTVQSDPHWSWMYSYNNEVLRDWLFSNSR